VTAVPANVLIDKPGRSIAGNLHGNELGGTVEKLFSKAE
jgi:hypothetical protein